MSKASLSVTLFTGPSLGISIQSIKATCRFNSRKAERARGYSRRIRTFQLKVPLQRGAMPNVTGFSLCRDSSKLHVPRTDDFRERCLGDRRDSGKVRAQCRVRCSPGGLHARPSTTWKRWAFVWSRIASEEETWTCSRCDCSLGGIRKEQFTGAKLQLLFRGEHELTKLSIPL